MKKDELGKEEAEEMEREELHREAREQEELEERVAKAEERIRERPLTWRPQPEEKKAVEVLDKVKKDTEFGETDFFIVKDLKSNQLFSLLGHGVLVKNLEVGKQYLLIYEGKVENGDKSYHRWVWEELE